MCLVKSHDKHTIAKGALANWDQLEADLRV